MCEKCKHYCSICSYEIVDGEDYIENHEDKFAHWDCIHSCRQLLEWFGKRIRIMEDE